MITEIPALFKTKPKLRGSKAQGLTFEKHVARKLKEWQRRGELYGNIISGQWFSFADANGHGYCQTDILIETADVVFILECKLTHTTWAYAELRGLYIPVVEKAFGKRAVGIQVCKNMYKVPDKLVCNLLEYMDNPPSKNIIGTWHFLGI